MEAKMESSSSTPHIAIFPSPGMGHLIPLIEFAKRLIHRHAFTITFIIPSDGTPMAVQRSALRSLPPSVSSVFLPQVKFDDLPQNTKIETIISLTVVRSLPHIRDAVAGLANSHRLVALVVDLFGTDIFDVAREFNLPPYIFFPSTATCLSLFFYLPTLDSEVQCEFRDMPEPVNIPGALPIPGSELCDPVHDRTDESYTWLLHQCKRYCLAEGILVNSFSELEVGPIRALLQRETPPFIHPVGPLVKMTEDRTADESSGCLTWLDSQPRGSVLYISFGSGGTLSSTQLAELALGLEISEQRFLWVVKSPNDKAANAAYLDDHEHNKDPVEEFLPRGFLERTKDRGLVVPTWAPQAQILAHVATGGFLTHCGWNSTLESVVTGVPLIAWPLYAEQKMNALLLTHDVKVALRMKPAANGEGGSVYRREEIAEAVKGLMQGEEGTRIRKKMRELKKAAATVLSEEGASTKALDEVALKWKNHHK